jgi:hypothetical protein
MHTLRNTLLVLGTTLLLGPVACAQDALEPARSQEFWLSMAVKGRPPVFLKDLLGDHYKRIRLAGELGYRSADNFFAGNQVYVDLSARYKVSKLLSLGAEYRYAARIQSPDRQRIGLQATLEKSFDRLDLGYRFTWQRNYLDQGRTRTLLRNQFSAAYNIPDWKVDPEFSVEFFTRTDDPRGWNHIGTRYKLGTTIDLWEGHTLGPAILYDRDGRVANPVYRTIWSIDYAINLRKT